MNQLLPGRLPGWFRTVQPVKPAVKSPFVKMGAAPTRGAATQTRKRARGTAAPLLAFRRVLGIQLRIDVSLLHRPGRHVERAACDYRSTPGARRQAQPDRLSPRPRRFARSPRCAPGAARPPPRAEGAEVPRAPPARPTPPAAGRVGHVAGARGLTRAAWKSAVQGTAKCVPRLTAWRD